MKIWNVRCAIEGVAECAVEANTKDEAIEKAINGNAIEDFQAVEWDINTKPYRGGWIEAIEEDQ